RLGAFPDPLAGDCLALRVVIANREVLSEILLGILQTVLCFGRKHGRKITAAGGERVSKQRASWRELRLIVGYCGQAVQSARCALWFCGHSLLASAAR